jgi:F-type H+-transporting ATPase subunit epsilon
MLKLKVVTPDRLLIEETIDSISVPTITGMITVLDKHAPIVSTIKAGEMTVKRGDSVESFAVHKGLINVRPYKDTISEVVVMLESAEKVDALDSSKIEEAIKRAEAMKLEKEEDVDFSRIEGTLERELNKIKIARKYRR